MMARAGLPRDRTAKPVTREHFFEQQQFIPVDHPLMEALRSLSATL
jgi:hypothetical protein